MRPEVSVRSFFLAIVMVLLLVVSAYATPVQWSVSGGGNGHYYEMVLSANPISWTTSDSLAENSLFQGAYGYLASITSQAENEFVSGLIGAAGWNDIGGRNAGPWIGGYQTENSGSASWYWTSGEAFSYSDWESGQPNNMSESGEYQNYINYFTESNDPTGEMTWNDHYDDGRDTIYGYIVEWEGTAAPVPAAAWLLGSGLLGLAGLKRKFKK